jgi:hypothetical protein
MIPMRPGSNALEGVSVGFTGPGLWTAGQNDSKNRLLAIVVRLLTKIQNIHAAGGQRPAHPYLPGPPN